MDPDACLDQMLEIANELVDLKEEDKLDDCAVTRLAELVLAMDGWLSKQGFLPRKWERL